MATAKPKAATPQRDLEKEMGVAAVLKQQLVAILGNDADAQAIQDTIEGETELFEMIDRVIEQIGQDGARVEGIKKFLITLAARAKRLEERADMMRSMLVNAMDMLGATKLERPVATISLRPVPPKLTVTDEAAVPSTYWKTPDPVLAKRELTDALKARVAAIESVFAAHGRKEIDDARREELLAKVEADHPEIPGAALSNGGSTVQIRFG